MAFGSQIIRLFMNTPYSHVYLKFYSPTLDRVLIYEAVGSGVRFIGSIAWSQHAEEVASFPLQICNSSYLQLMQYCIDNAGRKYGFLQNIGVALSYVFKEKFNRFKEGKNCSEVIADILEMEGIKIDIEKNLITPKDVYNRLSTL